WVPPFLFLPARVPLLSRPDRGCLLPPIWPELPARALSAVADNVSRWFLCEDALPASLLLCVTISLLLHCRPSNASRHPAQERERKGDSTSHAGERFLQA